MDTIVRYSLWDLRDKIKALGGDIEEKDINLRNILLEMLEFIDQALPTEVDQD